MPSTSPGSKSSKFSQILPGAPTESIQSFCTFIYRFKRYVAYISGSQLNLLSSPNTLVQAITFKRPLVAIAAEAKSGKIVAAGQEDVWVLEPLTEGWTKIWWEKVLLLRREDAGDDTYSLSWGNDGEVLVGGSRVLSLFSTLPSSRTGSPTLYPIEGETIEERRALWSKPVASAVRQAEFSPSSTMIASRSHYDRLVKIWRRLSFEEGLFDHTYLPHPGTITHLQWRPLEENSEARRGSGISGRHDEECEVLYTIANDGVLRVWRTAGMHDLDILVLHTTVDLIASIPQSPSMTIKGQSRPSKAPRYTVIFTSDQFSAAVNAAIGIPQNGKVNHSKELLKEMSSKELDVVVSFDGQGRMSAWGLQSIGHKRRPETPTSKEPIHISHAEGMHLRLPHGCPAVCAAWFQDDGFNMLTHAVTDGEIAWWQGSVESFFSPSAPGSERLVSASRWCGHDSNVLDLHSSGDAVISRSATDVTQWTMNSAKLLRPRRSFGISSDVLAATTVNSGKILLTVTASAFALWDESGQRIAKATSVVSRGGTFHVSSADERVISGLFVQDDAKTILKWTAQLPESGKKDGTLILQPITLTSSQGEDELTFAVPVAMPFDASKECVVCVTSAGRVDCMLLPEEGAESAELEAFVSFETGISEPAVFTANEEFSALASSDGKEIVIVDLTDGYIEHRQSLRQPVKHLSCFTPKPRNNFLALAYENTVDILAQGRYEHHRSDVPIWILIKSVSIAGSGLSIATVAWLPDGSLSMAGGNGVIAAAPEIDLKELDNEIQEAIDADIERETNLHLTRVTSWLKTPLPEWHPSLISHLLHHGHTGLATTLLQKLAQRLKFWSSGEELTLNESPLSFMQDLDQHNAWLDDDTVTDLREQLEEKDLPRTSQMEQQRLKHVLEALVYIREHVRSLDRHALRYLFNWKLQMLFSQDLQDLPNGTARPNGITSKQPFVPEMHWREICFAYHSSTQQALLDILILHHDNKMTWPIARRLGIMAWLSEREALETVFEQLGQTAYRSEQPPDPVNASLYFLALHKKPTLLALWRMATWHKEQRTTMNFLKRDFTQPEARTAARKNAYALMGKRRFEYAGAFFLLADDPASASSVLAGQCEDVQLGIAVARLYCGDGSEVLRQLLENRILPQAKQDGNRWLMSWCHAVLLEKTVAAETLVTPLGGVKTWHQDDPLTLLLYQHLRKTPSEHEYDAVLRSARILRRMGLWLLALELVSRWEFKHLSQPAMTSIGLAPNGDATNGVREEPKSMLDDFETRQPEKKEPPSMLDGFTQPEPSPPPPADDKAAREAKAAELLAKIQAKKDATAAAAAPELSEKKREPTQFKEPDPNSLLDNFGF